MENHGVASMFWILGNAITKLTSVEKKVLAGDGDNGNTDLLLYLQTNAGKEAIADLDLALGNCCGSDVEDAGRTAGKRF